MLSFRILGSWVFFSVTTLISILAIMKETGTASASGFVEIVLIQYQQLSRIVAAGMNLIPLSFLEVTEFEEVFFTSIILLTLPMVRAVFVHSDATGNRLAAVIYFIVIIGIVPLTTIPTSEDIFSVIAMFLIGNAIMAFGLTDNKFLSVANYTQNFVGAFFILFTLSNSGLVELAT